MKKTKKPSKRAIVTLCAVGFAALYAVCYILNINMRRVNQVLKEQNDLRKAYKSHVAEIAKGDLDDFLFYRNDDVIVEFTDEETERLLEAFDMVIPENEPDARPRLLGISAYYYYLEFDGITDRKAFYDANKFDRKRYFAFFDTWDDVDDNGEYTHYFTVCVQFESGGEKLKSPYLTKIEPLYKELSEEHFKRFKEQL